MSGRTVVNERIAERRAEVVAARRRAAARRLTIIATVLAVLVGAVALERSSLVALASLEVDGVERLDPQVVRAATEVEVGTSVLRISAEAVRQRVEAIPLVERATVTRDGPLRLVVTVEEVAPALTARFDDGDVIVGRDGLVLGTGGADGVPVVDVVGTAPAPGERAGDHPVLAAVHEVVLGLPGPLAAMVDGAGATSTDDVQLHLVDGPTVLWGDADRGAEKARALGAVLEDVDGRAVAVVDVSAPSAPTVTPGGGRG